LAFILSVEQHFSTVGTLTARLAAI